MLKISNYGNVKSFVTCIDGRLLSPKVADDGYLEIGLRDTNSNRKFYRISRLVAQTFISNPDNLPQVNHKNSNPLNNYFKNLEWCTVQYNNKYRFSKYGNGDNSCDKHPQTKLTNEIVEMIYLVGKNGEYSEPELAKLFNTTRSVINGIRLKYTWGKVTNPIDVEVDEMLSFYTSIEN